MGVLDDVQNLLELALLAIIAVAAVVILKMIFPAFKWFSEILVPYGIVSLLPLLIFAFLVIISIAWFVNILKG